MGTPIKNPNGFFDTLSGLARAALLPPKEATDLLQYGSNNPYESVANEYAKSAKSISADRISKDSSRQRQPQNETNAPMPQAIVSYLQGVVNDAQAAYGDAEAMRIAMEASRLARNIYTNRPDVKIGIVPPGGGIGEAIKSAARGAGKAISGAVGRRAKKSFRDEVTRPLKRVIRSEEISPKVLSPGEQFDRAYRTPEAYLRAQDKKRTVAIPGATSLPNKRTVTEAKTIYFQQSLDSLRDAAKNHPNPEVRKLAAESLEDMSKPGRFDRAAQTSIRPPREEDILPHQIVRPRVLEGTMAQNPGRGVISNPEDINRLRSGHRMASIMELTESGAMDGGQLVNPELIKQRIDEGVWRPGVGNARITNPEDMARINREYEILMRDDSYRRSRGLDPLPPAAVRRGTGGPILGRPLEPIESADTLGYPKTSPIRATPSDKTDVSKLTYKKVRREVMDANSASKIDRAWDRVDQLDADFNKKRYLRGFILDQEKKVLK